MQQSSFDFLKEHKHIYDFYKLTGEIRHAGQPVYERMLNIAREYAPGYMCCLHCPGDIEHLIKYVYKRFDEASITVETVPEPAKEFVKREKFPKEKNKIK